LVENPAEVVMPAHLLQVNALKLRVLSLEGKTGASHKFYSHLQRTFDELIMSS
jgi:hypothetical protein